MWGFTPFPPVGGRNEDVYPMGVMEHWYPIASALFLFPDSLYANDTPTRSFQPPHLLNTLPVRVISLLC